MESRSHKAESDGSYPEPRQRTHAFAGMTAANSGFLVYTAASVDKFPAFCLCAGAGKEQPVRFPK
ncbi:hypothetical protein DW023_09085 [Clostridium sp. AF37-7]|nr:hypothetical protein DW023_09085 [Clostridium sp. AF37-7]